MATPSENSTPTRHTRITSGSARAALPRRSTRGPLDISQGPVSGPTSPSTSQTLSLKSSPSFATAPSFTTNPSFATAPSRPALSPSTSMTSPVNSTRDFSKLLRPEIYHPLTQLETPPPFRTSSKQPSSTTPLPELLSTGHFRAAAILAAHQLTTTTSATNHVEIFNLLYTRLVCLTLINATALAAQEVKVLEDLSSSIYHAPLTSVHLVPWELRVLAVRLQGMGFNDARRGIVGYYDLAKEARLEISKLKGTPMADEAEIELWKERLADLGIRVAGALVEMEDLDGAVSHLNSLDGRQDGQVAVTKALLWLRIGDLEEARKCVAGEAVSVTAFVDALSFMADGEYEEAVTEFRRLCERDGENEMYQQNLAVCLLYSGRMQEAQEVLESLIENGQSFHALTFNLSTIYELCTDKSRAMKLELAERVATMPDSGEVGWEKSNADFKL